MSAPQIIISRCYAETTPESCEQGDFSDTGFVYEREGRTFSELVREIRAAGFTREGSTEWLTTGFGVTDYSTGTEREESLHFHRDNPPRLRKWFELALRTAQQR